MNWLAKPTAVKLMLELMSARRESLPGSKPKAPRRNRPGPIYNLNELGKGVGRRR
jgi:hypothetical protein